MLKNLDCIPRKAKHRRMLLLQSTGSVTHEIGHIVAAAFAAGIPTDYLLIDERSDAQHHAAYINERYYAMLAQNELAQVRIAAGGFVAEELIFGDAALERSHNDLECIASRLGIPFHEKQMPFLARHAQRSCSPIIPVHAVDLIRAIYCTVVSAIEAGRCKYDGAHVIPFYVFDHPKLPVPLRRRVAATIRTRTGMNRTQALVGLRQAVQSGL